MRTHTIRLSTAMGLVVVVAFVSAADYWAYVRYVVPELELIDKHRAIAAANRIARNEVDPSPVVTRPRAERRPTGPTGASDITYIMRIRTIRLAPAMALVGVAALPSAATHWAYARYFVPELELIDKYRAARRAVSCATATKLVPYLPSNPWPPCTHPPQYWPGSEELRDVPGCESCDLRRFGPYRVKTMHDRWIRWAIEEEAYCRFPVWLWRELPFPWDVDL